MFFKQFYLGCLAHASYLIGSAGEAAVVDPQRDVDQYIDEADRNGMKIKYIIETHLHADFVSGHTELAARTAAKIVFGEKASPAFAFRAVKSGDELRVGTVVLRIMETPGHTPESISILVSDTAAPGEPSKLLTGDTLFIGDVGRPDLVGSKGLTAEHMAGLLYDSIHNKILALDDSVEVYPAHGAGSLCGRNLSTETKSTIGEQRRFNYALQPMARDEFVAMMTRDLPEAPSYFPRDAEINRTGAATLGVLQHPGEIQAAELRDMAENVLILDVRPAAAYGAGHIPGSINIGLSGKFASWAGILLPPGKPLVLVADEPAEVDEAILRLARVGIENVAGYLAGGIYSWDRAGLPHSQVEQIPVDQLDRTLKNNEPIQLVDVRTPGEYAAGHAPGAVNIPLPHLEAGIDLVSGEKPVAVICASGYRSSAATSLLERRGFKDLYNVIGGTNAWIAGGYEVELPA